MDKDHVYRDLDLVHPVARGAFLKLATGLEQAFERGSTKSLFKPFETYRSPARQLYLFRETKNTKAPPWSSCHQYGLAVDFVPFNGGKWSWDESHDWGFLAKSAVAVGLRVPISWDRPHVEHPAWERVRAILR